MVAEPIAKKTLWKGSHDSIYVILGAANTLLVLACVSFSFVRSWVQAFIKGFKQGFYYIKQII